MDANKENFYLTDSFNLVLETPIKDECTQLLQGIFDAKLSDLCDESIFQNVPFISAAVSVLRVYSTLERFFCIKKLAHFLDEINRGISDDNRNSYIERYNSKSKKHREAEIEYLLIIINRYITVEQSRCLAKLYLSFLQDDICFEDLILYSSIINILIPSDIYFLINDTARVESRVLDDDGRVKRLRILGLIEAHSNERTNLGSTLCTILNQ